MLSITSLGDSIYSNEAKYDYKKTVFGNYEFKSLDVKGNAIYQAYLNGKRRYLVKDPNNDWLVSI